MSRRLGAGSSILFEHVLFDLSCSCPLVRASLRILLYTGIPYSSVIYLCAKYFLAYLLQLPPGYLHIDNLGGVDAKSSMRHPARPRSSTPSLSHFSFSLRCSNRVISEWSTATLAYSFPFPVLGLASYGNSNGRRRPC